MKPVITETDLIIPALVALFEHIDIGLTTAELQPILRDALQPMGEDLVLLEGRADDRFSQKVRNLRSHKRLEREHLATFDGERYHITKSGKSYIKRYGGVDSSLANQGFGENDKKNALSATKPIKFVEEGDQYGVSAWVRKRSRWLRAYAIKHFSDKHGKILCEGCGFEASACYGEDYTGLIEIHHKHPIAFEGGTVKPLHKAMANVAPLCPTCHRVVHARSGQVLSIEELQELLRKNKGG